MHPQHTAVGSPPAASAVPAGDALSTPEPAGAAPAALPGVPDGAGSSPAAARTPLTGGGASRWAPESYALLSALIPGAGQAAQGRWVAAGVQAATVVSYLAGALAVGGGRAFWLALGWNAWSAVDAYRHEQD